MADRRPGTGRPPAGMRVLAINAGAEASGAEVVLVRYLDALRRAGDEVLLAAPAGEVIELARRHGVRTVRLPLLKLGGRRSVWNAGAMAARWVRAAVTVRRLAKGHDVVLVNSLHALPAVRIARSGRPVAYLVHDVVRRRDLRLVQAFGAPAVDRVIAVSRSAGEAMRLRGVPTQLVRNGVPHQEPIRSTEPRVPPVVGVAARLTPWKGQHVAIRALAAMRHRPVLELAGGTFAGDEEYAAELRQLASSLGVADRVAMVGHVADMPARMRTWSLLLSPSVDPEAAPLNVAEALSLGVPVLATAHGGSAELPTPAIRLVAPDDPAALAAALDDALDDLPAFTDVARVHGPEFADTRLGLGRANEQFRSVLAGLAAGGAARDARCPA